MFLRAIPPKLWPSRECMPKMNDLLNIGAIEPKNYVNGPDCRFVIWVQGCHLACPECWNKHTWSFDKKNMVHIDELFEKISATTGISGVTFSGGEPFAQARNLYKLAQRVKCELDLNLQIFTGYEIDELKSKYQKKLLRLADIVVYGRFDPRERNNNQKVRFSGKVEWVFNNTNIEIDIDCMGGIVVTGYPSDVLIDKIQAEIR